MSRSDVFWAPSVEPIEQLLEQGCDLDLDVLPTVPEECHPDKVPDTVSCIGG